MLSDKSYFQTFYWLLKAELILFFQELHQNLLDTSIWVTLSILCNGYVLPKMGLTSSFGSLLALGHLVSSGIFLTYSAAMVMASDFSGDKTIAFELMMPIHPVLVFVKTALAWSIKSFVQASIILPLAKVLLGDLFSFANFCFLKFLIAYLLINLFVGAAAIFFASLNDSVMSTTKVWVRFIYPLWYLGGSIFPYQAVSQAFPLFAKFLLLNPVVYSTELIRAAVLGPDSHVIPFWISAAMLSAFSVLIFALGFYRLKNRLDFVA